MRFSAIAMVLLAGSVSFAGAVAAQTPASLAEAAARQDNAAVRALLARKASVDERRADGTTALHWAAHWNDVDLLVQLLKAGADPSARSRYGVTPIWEATIVGNARMVEQLLNAGASADTALPGGETVLMSAARTGNIEIVKLLLAHGAWPEARETVQGETALMYAAVENHTDVMKVLIASGADVDAQARVSTIERPTPVGNSTEPDYLDGGQTALMMAARQGNIEPARLLIEAGADVNYADRGKLTPLLLAVLNGHNDLAALLVERGANPNDGSLYEAVEIRNLEKVSVIGMKPLPKLNDKTDTLTLIRLMLARGANPDAEMPVPMPVRTATFGSTRTLPNMTPLQRAARAADLEVLRALLTKADPNFPNRAGVTALSTAVQGGQRGEMAFRPPVGAEDQRAAVTLLLDSGANVNLADAQGTTPLHIAAQAGNDDLVRLLVARGASLNVRNKQGRTPLDLAKGLGAAAGRGGRPAAVPQARESTVRLLLELGATETGAETSPRP